MRTPSTVLARSLRTVGYLGIAFSGGLLAYALPLGTAGGVYVMLSAWMGLGGLLCGLGALFDRWAGEFIGLPLLGSAMVAFGGVTIRDAHWSVVGIANLLLLVGLGLLFTARWRDVAAVARSAAKAARPLRVRR